MHTYKDVLGVIHCAGGNSERSHWNAETIDVGVGNFHKGKIKDKKYRTPNNEGPYIEVLAFQTFHYYKSKIRNQSYLVYLKTITLYLRYYIRNIIQF